MKAVEDLSSQSTDLKLKLEDSQNQLEYVTGEFVVKIWDVGGDFIRGFLLEFFLTSFFYTLRYDCF